MLAHGRTELADLAELCDLRPRPAVQGWAVDEWHLNEAAVDAAVAAYDAVLMGDAGDEIVGLLKEAGIDLTELLTTPDSVRDDITRSDFCELVAGGSAIRDGSCRPETMIMPNVPKMSRKKSDSGIDIIDIVLRDDSTTDELSPSESLTVVSVKHTIQSTTSNLRYALAESVSAKELTRAYLANQFRVVTAQLVESGTSIDRACRIYLFLSEFFDSAAVTITAIGLVDSTLVDDFRNQTTSLPSTSSPNLRFRCVFVPDLPGIHNRCR